MTDRVAKTLLYEQFARVGKALASPVRLELLDLLAQGLLADLLEAGNRQVTPGDRFEDVTFDFDTMYNLSGPVAVVGAELARLES